MRLLLSPVCALALAVAVSAPACGGDTTDETMSPLESEVLTLVNEERASNGGLPPLDGEGRLRSAASLHTDLMASRNELTHKFADERIQCAAGGGNDRYDAVGYPWTWCAENVARGQSTAREVVTAWMNSPPHRANILSPMARELGIAYRPGAGTHWWTQAFGAR